LILSTLSFQLVESILDSYPEIVGQKQCDKIKFIAFQILAILALEPALRYAEVAILAIDPMFCFLSVICGNVFIYEPTISHDRLWLSDIGGCTLNRLRTNGKPPGPENRHTSAG
jgi:hypothetical protein